eukprot:6324878-Amphidinium_carterae.1
MMHTLALGVAAQYVAYALYERFKLNVVESTARAGENKRNDNLRALREFYYSQDKTNPGNANPGDANLFDFVHFSYFASYFGT